MGTTFRNDPGFYHGRPAFASNVLALQSEPSLTPAKVQAAGNAEDYFRVASNVSTCFELALARQVGATVEEVYTFSSRNFPYICVGVANPGRTVHVYHEAGGEPPASLVAGAGKLESLGCRLAFHEGAVRAHPGDIVIVSVPALGANVPAGAHVQVSPEQQALHIVDASVVDPAAILRRRKRLCTPLTTPMCKHQVRG